jgi:hypothetical protein
MLSQREENIIQDALNVINAGCPTCEHDGCFGVRYCEGCQQEVCVGCWGEHNNDEAPNDHTTAMRPEAR